MISNCSRCGRYTPWLSYGRRHCGQPPGNDGKRTIGIGDCCGLIKAATTEAVDRMRRLLARRTPAMIRAGTLPTRVLAYYRPAQPLSRSAPFESHTKEFQAKTDHRRANIRDRIRHQILFSNFVAAVRGRALGFLREWYMTDLVVSRLPGFQVGAWWHSTHWARTHAVTHTDGTDGLAV